MTQLATSSVSTQYDRSKEIKDKSPEDYITSSMGEFGLWQFFFVLIVSSTRAIASWNTMSIIFLAPETKFVCKKFHENTDIEAKNNTCYDSCVEYEYTSDVFEDTLISEFQIICKNEWYKSFIQSIMMLGVLCGVSLFGWFSDRFGRSKAIVLAGAVCAIFMLATPFCPSFWTFLACRFLSGLGTGGYLTLTPVYLSELVGIRIIDLTVCAFLAPFDGVGLLIHAAFAYFTSTWRTFMVVTSSVTVIMVCVTFFLPETPRWLVAKGKDIEAIELMTKAAQFNNLETINIKENVTNATKNINLKDKKDINLSYLDLFRTKKLAKWSVASVSMWFVTGFSFFGLLQHISSFGSNLYIVCILLGIVQVIASPLSILLVKFCGRKVSSICIYTTIGALSLALVFVPKESNAAIVLGALGVTAATIVFFIAYVIVIELYPTPMRNMGLSVSSIGSKVAAMVAPFVVNMQTKWIASSIFAAVGFSAVISCLLLPETKGKKLKDSVDDIKENTNS